MGMPGATPTVDDGHNTPALAARRAQDLANVSAPIDSQILGLAKEKLLGTCTLAHHTATQPHSHTAT